MKLHIVATVNTTTPDEDNFSDIILVTQDETKATHVRQLIEDRKPIEGLDYDLLVEYDGVIVFERELDEVLNNKQEE